MAIAQEQPDGTIVIIEPDFITPPAPLPCELVTPAPQVAESPVAAPVPPTTDTTV